MKNHLWILYDYKNWYKKSIFLFSQLWNKRIKQYKNKGKWNQVTAAIQAVIDANHGDDGEGVENDQPPLISMTKLTDIAGPLFVSKFINTK